MANFLYCFPYSYHSYKVVALLAAKRKGTDTKNEVKINNFTSSVREKSIFLSQYWKKEQCYRSFIRILGEPISFAPTGGVFLVSILLMKTARMIE